MLVDVEYMVRFNFLLIVKSMWGLFCGKDFCWFREATLLREVLLGVACRCWRNGLLQCFACGRKASAVEKDGKIVCEMC